jgi:hypothetical protein
MEHKLIKIIGNVKIHGESHGELKAIFSFLKPIKMDLDNAGS